ncbi:hypothetical protein KKC94_01775 [Patescibacteria group bacterium]|nr:hypothetical protein [Patescibacteria group bacterium]
MKLPSKPKKWLIIPVEVKSREFESRLLIALYAIQNNFNVIFGSQRQVLHYLNQLPRGIYFDKSISKNKFDSLQKIVDRGFTLTSIDEEGYPRHMKGHFYLKQRISACTLAITKKFFTWGKLEQKVVQGAYPDEKEKIIPTGNPRLDLWREPYTEIFSDQAKDLQNQFGDYILIPSNFSSNHINGPDFLIKQAWQFGIIENKEDEDLYKKFLKEDHVIAQKIPALIKKLANSFPDNTIIFRPHPGENLENWKKLEKYSPNIKVIRKGNVTAWIMGARLIIHSSCTTGLESFILKKPVISYLPFGESEIRTHVSDLFSEIAKSKSDLIEKAKKLIQKPEDTHRKEKLKKLEKHFNSLEGSFASEKIIQELKEIPLKKTKISHLRLLILKTKKYLRLTRSLFSQPKKNQLAIQKFPSSSLKEVKEISSMLAAQNKDLPKSHIKQIEDSLFVLWA